MHASFININEDAYAFRRHNHCSLNEMLYLVLKHKDTKTVITY